ncbi:MAG: hypothetical protein IPM82_25345 [Saprospiraceae bacterium]|nr:hypothetical protein [Saprospiraceae bacterium]
MRLVLEIKHEKDLKILLPLLERLKIQVAELPSFFSPKKKKDEQTASKQLPNGRNYDPEQLAAMFDQLRGMNAFFGNSRPCCLAKTAS